FAGIMSSVSSASAYVVLPPLGALLYLALGRHPLAGLAAPFAGVSGGFSANLLLSGTDVMLMELSAAGASVIDPAYADSMNVAFNWYFIATSVFLLTLVRSEERRVGKDCRGWGRRCEGNKDVE